MPESRPLATVVQLSAREPSDAALVARVLAGARNAEEALYTRHVGHVLALSLRLLGDRDEAEDVLQETFLAVFEQLPSLREPALLTRWITGIVVDKAEALFRRRRARRFVLARSLAREGASFLRPAADVSPALREELGVLDVALTRLRDRDRACWLLHHVDGYTTADVAELTHRPLAIVKRRIARAERALRLSSLPALAESARLAPLKRLLDASRPANARELLRGFQARRELRGRPDTLWTTVLRASVLLMLVLTLVLISVTKHARHEALPLTLRDQRNLPRAMLTASSHHAFDLSDGSRITLAPGARVDVVDSTLRALVLAQRDGRVRFDIQPSAARSWRIELGALSVEVGSGKLVVERAGEHVRVRVEQGAVVLRGEPVPDRVQRLGAGQHFEVDLSAR